ncbi:hypothetical protein Asulf_01202 [Archaeoglobus sulfaticallidus PM70-1]|uniref:Na+-dependent transporter n=2 Tax=Archaeoglobus TaxID=2233 RepID=N0BLT0_9EURY|nr:hypothetical protein Asulf_01202 [Archaeoglobus sulfaticallidus PM70-1]
MILKKSPFIFTLAMVLGILFPQFASSMKDLIIPILAFVMILSLKDLDFRNMSLKSGFLNVLLNYLFLSGVILVLSFLIEDEALRLGFIVMASAPPAVAIVPFSKLLAGDVTESVVSNGMAYLLSLAFTPAILLAFTGEYVSMYEVLKALVVLIMIPLIFSRFIRVDGEIFINLGFGIVIYTIIGLNISTISVISGLPEVIFAGFVRTFIAGTVIFLIFIRKGYSTAITKALFSSYKNLGFTAGVAMMLFGDKASIPAAICVFFEVLVFNYYTIFKKYWG